MWHIRPWLAVGGYHDTVSRDHLTHQGISAMLQLAEPAPHAGIPSLYLAVADGTALPTALLERGLAFVRTAYQEGRRVLISCGIGISRSVTFALAALCDCERLTLRDALTAVKQRHPAAMPHPALWASLCTYYRQPLSYACLLEP